MPIKAIILDLDETLVHGTFHKNGKISMKIRSDCQKFLTYLFENYNVGIWTFASKEWAKLVINQIFTKEQQKKLVFVYHGEMSCPRKGGDIKCLSKIWDNNHFRQRGFTPQNVLIIEDTSYNYIENPNNGILVPKFKGEKDDVLVMLMEHMEKHKHKSTSNFPKNFV